MAKEIQNKFDLPPSLFAMVCEKTENPENARDVYDILLQEIEIQAAAATDYPNEEGRFPTIMQCALILEGLRNEPGTQDRTRKKMALRQRYPALQPGQ